ncbi:MAG TPA: hypothetical protein VNB22_16830, partial [Pyrinomonadaceae bacterium]|nr:hypothetical protein [Pyrinomonadaceae bacterium]
GTFGSALAQENKIKVSAEEADAIKKIEKAKTLADKMKATTDFVKKYPKSPAREQAANYLAGQITQTKDDAQIVQNGEAYLTVFTEPAEEDLILPSLVYSYSTVKRTKDAFAVAEKYFSRHPEDVALRLKLAVDGANLLRTGTKDFAAPSREYAAQSIALIEANKKPANITDAGWKEYQTKWLPQLYQTLGVFDFYGGDKANAGKNLEKATSLDSSDVNSWILLVSIKDEEYQAIASKYNITDLGAERDALLKQANEKLDQVIDMFARVVALTDGKPEAKEINDQVRQNLESYYTYRHKNLDGLPDLIKKYKK